MTSILWTERARADLVDIADYIAQRSPASALSFVDELMERTLVLSDQPRSGRVVPEVGSEELRELIHGNYRIVYRLLSGEAHILTVFEGHRLVAPKGLEQGQGIGEGNGEEAR